MISLLKQKTPANILILFVFGILIKLPIFKDPYQPTAIAADGILYRNIIDVLGSYGKSTPVIFPILAYLLIFTQALQLNKLINDQRMMQKTTYLPAASYLLVTSLQHDWNLFRPAYWLIRWCCLFLMACLDCITSKGQKELFLILALLLV